MKATTEPQSSSTEMLSEQEYIFYIGKNPQCVTQVTLREKSP